jgi:hypothetical protein
MVQSKQPTDGKTVHELVTVTMRYTDYESLRKRGLAMNEQVSFALTNYLRLLRDGELPSKPLYVVPLGRDLRSIRCALPKRLCDQIRALGGRFDLHALEAIRLCLL